MTASLKSGLFFLSVAVNVIVVAVFIMWSLTKPQTHYSSGFDETKFKEINCEMNSPKVLETLGVPLKITFVGDQGAALADALPGSALNVEDALRQAITRKEIKRIQYWYSQPADHGSYEIRVAEIEPDGRLYRTYSSSYSD